jgi:hypothetical protein
MSYKLQIILLIIGLIASNIITRLKRSSPPVTPPTVGIRSLSPGKRDILAMSVYNLNGTHPPLPNSFRYDSSILHLDAKNSVFSFKRAGNYLVTVVIEAMYNFYPVTIYLNRIGRGNIDYNTFVEGDAVSAVFQIKAEIDTGYYIYYTLGREELIVPIARVVVTQLL